MARPTGRGHNLSADGRNSAPFLGSRTGTAVEDAEDALLPFTLDPNAPHARLLLHVQLSRTWWLVGAHRAQGATTGRLPGTWYSVARRRFRWED